MFGVLTANCSPDYIIEKWNRYIGVVPIKNDKIPSFSDIMENRHLYSETLKLWIDTWKVKNWKVSIKSADHNDESYHYDNLKEILNFILIVNSKGFSNDIDYVNWIPSELIETFEKHIGSVKGINDDKYQNLHEVIMRKIHDEWLSSDQVYRDYKLCLLVD